MRFEIINLPLKIRLKVVWFFLLLIIGSGGCAPSDKCYPDSKCEPDIITMAGETTLPLIDVIAFQSGSGLRYDIYAMLSDGSQKINLATQSGNYYFPAWSADGQYLALTRYNLRDGNLEIYSLNLVTLEEKNLTNNPSDDSMPSWSPDGKKIAFVSEREGNPMIYVMNADGSDTLKLTDNQANEGMPSWSPDGKTIAFVSNMNGTNMIYTIGVDGTHQQRLNDESAEQLTPAWSYSGDKIAYAQRAVDGSFDIFVMDFIDHTVTNLTNRPGDDLAPAWSPNGDQIVFMGKVNETFALFLINRDGSGITQLTNYNNNSGNPVWQKIPLTTWNKLQALIYPTLTPSVDVVYIIQREDTLSDISRKYGVSEEVILTTNQIEGLTVGQTIILPGVLTTDPVTGARVHFVKEGETAFFIADLYDVSVDELLARNELVEPLLFVGQRLVIP